MAGKTRRTKGSLEWDPSQYTKAQLLGNWWHYHKWFVIIAVLAVVLVVSFLRQTVFAPEPDCQVSLVTRQPLPDALLDALPGQLEALTADENGDGRVLVRVEPYVLSFAGGETMMDDYANFAGETQLNVDIEQGRSMIFITDDPVPFAAMAGQMVYPDGTVPADAAAEAEAMALPWAESAGAQLDLGTFFMMDGTERDCQEALEGMYLMRRSEVQPGVPGGLSLWQALTEAE